MFHYQQTKELPRLQTVIDRAPLSSTLSAQIGRDRQEIAAMLSQEDDRLLVIVGPCSLWPGEACLEYARRLVPLAEELSDKVKIVMRAYVQKPRTTVGWKGPFFEPDPLGEPDIAAGMLYSRALMHEIVSLGLPIASEILFPGYTHVFGDLLSYVAIGARSTENQEHRMLASSMTMPVGMKNPTSGDLDVGVKSVVAAQHGHVGIIGGMQAVSFGNPLAHLVLRGGKSGPNYGEEHLHTVLSDMENANLPGTRKVVIDVSHDNLLGVGIPKKDPRRQGALVDHILDYRKKQVATGGTAVAGLMIESFLEEGSQSISDDMQMNGLSITDPCLGWKDTESLLYRIASSIS